MKANILSLLALTLALTAFAEKRPNIVWIFSDDHTNQAIGAYGGPLAALDPTPNIDRLSAEGMRFDHCYVGNSICAPARATLLTGKHSHIHGKIDNINAFDHSQMQFQKLLQKSGYQTAMIGKIHLSGPMQGFDHWEVLPGQGSYYQPEFRSSAGREFYQGYVTDIITGKAIDWMDQKRDSEKPFLLMVHHKGTHRTWMPAPRHVGLLDDVELPVPETLFDDYAGRGVAAAGSDMSIKDTMRWDSDLKVRTEAEKAAGFAKYKNKKYPGGERGAYFRMNATQRGIWDAAYDPRNQAFFDTNYEEGSPEWVEWRYQRYVKDYLRTAMSIDESVGAILDYLKANGLDEHTIVMYSSDQGFYLGEHGWFDKRFMYQESFRAPLLARWPGTIEPGAVNRDLVQNIDFAETFLDLAGVEAPADMQGVSIVPLLRGERPADWRDALYYHYYQYPGTHSVRRHEGVFDGRWKLIRFYGPDVPDGEQFELYDLKHDPRELTNIYNNPENGGAVERLRKRLHQLKKQYAVPEDDEI